MVYSNLNGKFIAPWIPAKLCWEIGKFLSSGFLTSQKGYVCNEHPQLVVGRWRKSKSKWVGESRQISGAKFLGNLGYGIVYSVLWIAVEYPEWEWNGDTKESEMFLRFLCYDV